MNYSYSIERDRSGLEVSRTEPWELSSIGWDDGTPLTEDEFSRISNGLPRKRGFFARLFGF
ncbi:MAG: hypothetical protein V3S69_04165 [Dehalococcoidales bacterium]